MRNQFKFFRVQVRQKYQVSRVQVDINTKSAFRLNRFLFVDMLFGNVRNECMLSSHLLCKYLVNFLEHFKTPFCACLKNRLEMSLW